MRFAFPRGMTKLLFLLSLLFPTMNPPHTVVTPAVVDRIEEAEWLVLDVPPHPSLNVPLRIAPSLHEGDAVTVTVARTPAGSFTVQGRNARGLVLADSSGIFHWPEALAPVVAIGDTVSFTLVFDPVETEARRAAIRALRDSMEGSEG